MALRRIFTWPDPLLHRVSRPVTEFNSELKTLAEDMVETMRRANGIGLAAPQVGELLRLIVLEIPDQEERTPPTLFTVCNPVIENPRGKARIEEGCLSVPGLYVEIDRAAEVKVTGQNLDGTPFSVEANALLAICFQHEMDHLEGKLIVNEVSPVKREMYRSEVKRRKEAGEEVPTDHNRSPL